MAIELEVTAHEVKITNSYEINQGEFNISSCIFTFSAEYNDSQLIKKAIFSNVLDNKYESYIDNNICTIPEAILALPGKIAIGVYAYIKEDNNLILRYSPTPAELEIKGGSYVFDDNVIIDTSDATATSDDIAQGKTAYVNKEKITGTMPTTTQIITPSTSRQQITNALHIDSYVKAVDNTIDEDIKPENIKAGVNILGVDGSFDGLVGQEKVVTPTTETQIITPDEDYTGLTKVTVNQVTKDIDSNIKAENIKEGVNILGVDGSVVELRAHEVYATPSVQAQDILPWAIDNAITVVHLSGVTSEIDRNITPNNIKAGVTILGVEGNVEPDKPDQSKTVNPSTRQQIIRADIGYELASVTVTAIQTEQKEVKSTTSSQTITPTSGKFIDEITVEALDLETKNVTPTTSAQIITPTQGKDGISQINVSAVDNTIDNNIVANNIKARN